MFYRNHYAEFKIDGTILTLTVNDIYYEWTDRTTLIVKGLSSKNISKNNID